MTPDLDPQFTDTQLIDTQLPDTQDPSFRAEESRHRTLEPSHRGVDERDQRLDALLQGMPRAEADDQFSNRVLRAIRQDAPAPADATTHEVRGAWRLPLALAAAAVMLALVVFRPAMRTMPTFDGSVSPRSTAAGRGTQSPEHEYQQLAAELEALETLRAKVRPVVYLGSASKTDFVLDLERLARRRAQQAEGALSTSNTTSPTSGRLIPARYDGGNIP